MEWTGFKKRLNEAKETSEPIKILFQYPDSAKVIVRKGKVIEINPDSFSFDDRFVGEMTFSYDFIIEISKWEGE
jgi:hypothetical protein